MVKGRGEEEMILLVLVEVKLGLLKEVLEGGIGGCQRM